MQSTLNRILIVLYLIINILFIEKYASRITEYHLIVSIVYVVGICVITYLTNKKKLLSISTSKWLIIASVILLCFAIGVQYAIDPYSLQVDRWSAIHNFLKAMFKGEYPYGSMTHLGGYGSPFPIWQLAHIPFYFMGNVGLSIFVVSIFFIITLYKVHSSKTALIACFLLIAAPAFWYEMAVRSDLITNIILVATLVEWLVYTKIKLKNHTIQIGIIAGLLLSTRIIAIIPICVIYGYEFLKIGWKKQMTVLLTAIITFAITLLPFLLWEGSTLYFFKYSPFILQTRQGSLLVLLIFAVIAISVTIYLKGQLKYRMAVTGLLLTVLVTLAFVDQMWQYNLWQQLFSPAFDITYLSMALPFYIEYLSCSITNDLH